VEIAMASSRKRGRRRGAAAEAAESAARPTPTLARSSSNASVGTAVVIPSTVAQNEFGRVFDRAMAGTDVAIAKHNVVRAVLVSVERYQELVRQQIVDLDALSSRFEQLYASMQRPEVQEATDRAFRATPTEMGRAAVTHARRSRRVAGRAGKKR
jgi:antitoxin Phd